MPPLFQQPGAGDRRDQAGIEAPRQEGADRNVAYKLPCDCVFDQGADMGGGLGEVLGVGFGVSFQYRRFSIFPSAVTQPYSPARSSSIPWKTPQPASGRDLKASAGRCRSCQAAP